jgi:hypothetical protein
MIFMVKGYNIQIDDEDAERVMSHAWWVSSSPEIDGHVLCFSAKIGKKIGKLHRFIMGSPAGRIVDQRDGTALTTASRICGFAGWAIITAIWESAAATHPAIRVFHSANGAGSIGHIFIFREAIRNTLVFLIRRRRRRGNIRKPPCIITVNTAGGKTYEGYAGISAPDKRNADR